MPERSVFAARDLAAEALGGVLQRPGRSLLTTVGTVLGVGAFVAVLGLTSTAAGQIGKRFDALRNTTVTVTDDAGAADVGTGERTGPGGSGPSDTGPGGSGPGDTGVARADGEPPVSFPADADTRIGRLNGAVAAGVYWTVPLKDPLIGSSRTVDRGSPANAGELPVYAASAGLLEVIHPAVRTGTLFNGFHDRRGERVAVLGSAAATRLGIVQLSAQPAVFINDTAFTVVGIIDDTQRLPELLLGIVIPRTTGEQLFQPPSRGRDPARMVIQTQPGAAALIARQAPLALRPDRPELLRAVPPPDPRSLRSNVDSDLAGLFLFLAAICLLVGAVGILNTTLVAVLERVGEIGLRRSLGARPWHIAVQFLTESTALGTLGGLVGTAIGVAVVVSVALLRDWTAVLEPVAVLPAPAIGGLIGMLAGAYPAARAATIEPLEALRR